MKDKVLVVGGTGFIGYHVLKNLSKKKYFLYSLSKKNQKKKTIKKYKIYLLRYNKIQRFKKKVKLSF